MKSLSLSLLSHATVITNLETQFIIIVLFKLIFKADKHLYKRTQNLLKRSFFYSFETINRLDVIFSRSDRTRTEPYIFLYCPTKCFPFSSSIF